ncbi:MAG TPA: histone deacetylase [Acidimicrobiales bacterium]|nr:histone deacetylase [Acidimicrobiales bacterium]
MVLVVNGAYDDSGHEDPGHPERPSRTEAARAAIGDLRLGSDLVVVEPYAATRAELTRVHAGGYLDELGAYCYAGGGDLDPDTYATFDSWSIATQAAGAGLAVIKELRRRDEGVGFVVARPPGHHALSDRAMGFCLLNNVAVAAAALRDQGERVLIVDWDVHHGNGTQAIFWDDPGVLYVSTHQWPLYPGTGSASEVGGTHAIDSVINIPLPAGATGDVLGRAINEVAAPVIDAFDPTWVLVSAGFDAHRDDPIAELQLASSDFADLARGVAGFAPRPGRVALFLEGGYHLDALRSSIHSALSALLGDARPDERSRGGPGLEQIARTQSARRAAIETLRSANDDEEAP